MVIVLDRCYSEVSEFVESLGMMRYWQSWRSGLVLVAMGFAGCASPTPQAPPEKQLQVITTFAPMTQFTQAVAGDRAKVTQLLPANIGPHDYQSKPEDVQKLAQADVLVQNGLEMEEFLDDLVKNAGNGRLKTIDTSQGVPSIKNEAEPEGHADHDHKDEKPAEKSATAGKSGEAHDHGEFNPHIWLDPKRVIKQVENIRDGLIAADADGKAIYTANAAAYIEKLKQLDTEITAKLKPYSGKTFVTYHDFSPYFAQSYGLKAEFLVDIPEENPAPEDVKRVIEAAKASGLKTLLSEPQAGDNRFAALAKDLQVKVSTFDPAETANPEDLQPDGYLRVMRQNASNLEGAFSGR
jgi:zinc transport system substrate-binding protein